jgi:hypothetical protein
VNTQGNITRSGRGNLSDLLKAQRNSDLGTSAITAQANQRADALMPMEGQLVGAMAQRAYDRQLSNANRMWSEYARKREDSNRQIMAGIGMLPNVAAGFGKARPGISGNKIDFATPGINPMLQGTMGNDIIGSSAIAPIGTPANTGMSTNAGIPLNAMYGFK